MAKKRKTRASASTTEPDSEPKETQQNSDTEPPIISEPIQNQETIVSEPELNQEEAILAESVQNQETIQPEQNQEEAILAETLQNQETIQAVENQEEANEEENGVSEQTHKEEKEEELEEELEEESVENLIEPFTKNQLTLLMKEAVSKHPDLMENVNKLADFDPSHRKIFVHGLGWDSTIETITPIFQEFGEIEDCTVVKDKVSGKSKGYAFILFKTRKSARLALKEPQKMIGGRMTSSQLASAGPVTNHVTNIAVGAELNVSELTLRKIFVSNVGAETDTNKLVEFFAKFGEIEDGPLGLDKLTGKPRGFCLFVYKSVESAKKALEEPHKSFEGQMLHCQQAVDGPRNGKGSGGFQQQGNYRHAAKRGRYGGSDRGGHMMAPSARPVYNNPVVAPEAIGQAFAALLAQSGGGYGSMMNNAGYGGQGGGYGVQPGYQGGYGGQTQTGQGGVWPYQGGAPYMGRGR